jgi:hypothetical protein
MVVGQDWGDVSWFVREGGKTTSSSVTNRTLINLLQSIGFDIPLARDSSGRGALFFTNAILCLKTEAPRHGSRASGFRTVAFVFCDPSLISCNRKS